MMSDRLSGVARHEEDYGLGMNAFQTVCQHTAVHLGHDNVCEEQVDRLLACLSHSQAFGAALCLQYPVAATREQLAGELPDRDVVLHQENGFWAAGALGFLRRRR